MKKGADFERAPRRLPRDEVDAKPAGVMTAGATSPLGVYLESNKISVSSFARALGCDTKTASSWAKGESIPSLAAAYEIERVCKGVVPMESWLALPGARKFLADVRAKQEEGVRQFKQEVGNAAGGFAMQDEGEVLP